MRRRSLFLRVVRDPGHRTAACLILECNNMPTITDQDHLVTRQYKDAANLTARGSLHERLSTNKAGWFGWVFDQLAGLPEQSSSPGIGLWTCLGVRTTTGAAFHRAGAAC